MKYKSAQSLNMSKTLAAGILLSFTMMVLTGIEAQAKPEPREHKVDITNFVFVPATVNVQPGDTITWTNRDIVPHTATAEGGSWDTGSISMNESKSLVFTADMISDYFCRFHPTMKGSVDVNSD